MLNKYKVSYEVYNVEERLEESGLPDKYTIDIDPSWYEYEVFLLDSSGEIIAEWDSYTETYNGIQQLTKESAERAAKEVKEDIEVQSVNAHHWFTFKEDR